ncbi:MAG: hypothetical protein DRG87_12820 [Deltaproteobacteria bacterium]|nr:MAG: hypothetical protein DRG87_12820 [Deltaproteobacteria bacterium]
MAISDSAVAQRAKAGWPFGELKSRRFGAVPLAYTTDAPRGSAGSFTYRKWWLSYLKRYERIMSRFKSGKTAKSVGLFRA